MLVTWFKTAISTLLIGGYSVGHVVQNSNFYPSYWWIQCWSRGSKPQFLSFIFLNGGYSVGHVVQNRNFYRFYLWIQCWSRGLKQPFLPYLLLLVDTILVTRCKTAVSTLLIGRYSVGHVVQNSNFYCSYWWLQCWSRGLKQPFLPFLFVDTVLVTWFKIAISTLLTKLKNRLK